MFISLIDRDERNTAPLTPSSKCCVRCSRSFPTIASPFVQDQGGSSGSDITVQFVGQDPAAVNAAADRLAAAMGQLRSADRRALDLGAAPPGTADPPAPGRHGAARRLLRVARLRRPHRHQRRRRAESCRATIWPIARFRSACTLRPDRRSDLDAHRARCRCNRTLGAPVRLDAVADVSSRSAKPRSNGATANARSLSAPTSCPASSCRRRSRPCSACPKRRTSPARASPPPARPKTSRK